MVMLFAPALLALSLTGPVLPVQSSMPPTCFVYGEVTRTDERIHAELSSNCPIDIEQREQLITMRGKRGQQRTLSVSVPQERGTYQFVYRWGNSMAQFNDQAMQVAMGTHGR